MIPKVSKQFEVHFRFLHLEDYDEAFPEMSRFKQLMACDNQVLLRFTSKSCKHLASPPRREICSSPKSLKPGASPESPFTSAGTGCNQEFAHCKGKNLLYKCLSERGHRGCSGTMAERRQRATDCPQHCYTSSLGHPSPPKQLVYAFAHSLFS